MMKSLLVASRAGAAVRIAELCALAWLAFALTVLPASAAPRSERAQIEQIVRMLAEAQDAKDFGAVQGLTWPDGRFSVRSFAPGERPTRRPWSKLVFGGIGVNYHSRITHLGVRIKGASATAWVHLATRVDYADEDSGLRLVSHNLVRLERRKGGWGVLNWDRRVRQYGSDEAWHRRHP